MPKFYRQNRKNINPRYFLNETAQREDEADLAQCAQHLLQGEKCSGHFTDLESLNDRGIKMLANFFDDISNETNCVLTTCEVKALYHRIVQIYGKEYARSMAFKPEIFQHEVEDIKNRYKEIDQMFDNSIPRGLDRGGE